MLVPELDAWRSRAEEAPLGEDARLAEAHAEAAIAPCSSSVPSRGPNSAIEAAQIGGELWGRPGSIYFLTDEPLRISEVSAMAAMRKRMQDGVATPQEIAEFERRGDGAGGAHELSR